MNNQIYANYEVDCYELTICLKITGTTDTLYFYTEEGMLNFITRVKNDISWYKARKIENIRFVGLEDRSML